MKNRREHRWFDHTKNREYFGNREGVVEFRKKVRRNGSKNRIGRIGSFGEEGRKFRGEEEEEEEENSKEKEWKLDVEEA